MPHVARFEIFVLSWQELWEDGALLPGIPLPEQGTAQAVTPIRPRHVCLGPTIRIGTFLSVIPDGEQLGSYFPPVSGSTPNPTPPASRTNSVITPQQTFTMLGDKFKSTVSTGCAVALQPVRAVDSAADSFGPLKAVTGPAIYIAETVKEYQSHRKDWTRFSEHVQETLVILMQRIHDAEGYDKGALLRDMEKLRGALDKTKWKMEEYERKRHKWWYFLKKPHFIEDLRKEFEETILSFKMEISLSSALDVAEIQRLLEDQNLQPFLEKLDLNLTRAMTAINLSNLPVADNNMTWNCDNCCLEGIRIEILNDILEWLSATWC